MKDLHSWLIAIFYTILGIITYFIGFDLKEVFAIELWGYEYPINYSEIRYKKTSNGAENNLTDGVNNSETFAVGITDKFSGTIYWNLYTTGFVNGHAYELRLPVCNMDSGYPSTITTFSINGSLSNRTLNHYSIVGQDPRPYVATSGPVTALTGCGTAIVNFDYTGTSSSANSTNYVTISNTSTTNSTSKRWVVWGFYLEDLGTSATLMRSEADRIISAIGGSVLNDIDSNVNDINSNLNYDGSDSDIDSPDSSNLNEYLSNQNELLNDSNIQDFDFSDYKLSDTDFSFGIVFLMNIVETLFMYFAPFATLVGVALTLSIVALLLNRK